MSVPHYAQQKRCPGLAGDPFCGNTIGWNTDLCEACKRKQEQHDAAIGLYASTGTRDLEHYLTSWAAFADWLTSHPEWTGPT